MNQVQLEIVKPPFRKLDAAAARPLRTVLKDAWSRGPRTIAIDLSGVAYVDSLGLSALVAENRNKPNGTSIVLFGLTDYVREVFEITRMSILFEIFESDAAVYAAHEDIHAAAAF
jgi:anti-sigma B factor antagonist